MFEQTNKKSEFETKRIVLTVYWPAFFLELVHQHVIKSPNRNIFVGAWRSCIYFG